MRQRSTFDLSAPHFSLPQRTNPLPIPEHSKGVYRWRDKNPWGEQDVFADDAWGHEPSPPQSDWQRNTKQLAAPLPSRSHVLTRPLEGVHPFSRSDLLIAPAFTLPLHAVPKEPHPDHVGFTSIPFKLKLWLIGIVLFTVLAATLTTAGGGKGISQLFSAFHTSVPRAAAAAVSMADWPITAHVQPIIQADNDAGYDSQAQHDDWWDSVCSAASFTEVARAWGNKNVTLGQVLDRLLAHDPPYIAASGGLLSQDGWEWMAQAYGLKAQVAWHAYTFDGLVKQVTTSGIPMVIGMEGGSTDSPWGHFVVVTGGDNNQVQIADSSLWKMQSLPRSFFSEPTYGIINDPIWWSGETVLLTPA
ncbi:MAG TPA: C39 family peptidase [Ktedonobacterales bacterium]|nr:C39 family peptidase [Ktedonobacterales bacterium]